MSIEIVSRMAESNMVKGEDIIAIIFIKGKLLTAINTLDRKGIVKVWSGDLTPLYDLEVHEFPIYHMALGPQDTFFTSASDCTICHWEEDQGRYELADILRGHSEPATRLRFDTRSNRLYSGDCTGQVLMWQNGEKVGCLGTVEDIWDMTVDNGTLYTTRYRDVYLTTFKPRAEDGWISWSIQNTIDGTGPLLIVDKRLFLQHRSNYSILLHTLGEVGNPLVSTLKGHTAIVTSLVASSTHLYSGGYDCKVISWDMKSLEKCGEVDLTYCIYAMALDPVSGIVYAGGQDRSLCALK